MTISIPEIGIWGEIGFPTAEVSVSEILHAGVNLIVDRLEDSPTDFRHSLPRGIQDLIFCELQGAASTNSWTLMGERKAELRDRTVGRLFPAKSIDLVRATPVETSGIRVQSRQWLGHDYSEIPDTLMEELREGWPADLPWFGCFFEKATKAGGLPHYLQNDKEAFDSSACLMEFIGQFTPSEAVFDGNGYLFHSTTTGETVAVLQTT